MPLSERINMVGKRVGRLTVVSFAHTSRKRAHWNCVCDCGNSAVVCGTQLRFTNEARRTRSCGCLQREMTGNASRTHGYSSCRKGTPKNRIYSSFKNAKRRCTDPTAKQFADYGGRGIEFRFKSIEEYDAALGPRPSLKHTVDRINNDGHYEPGNIRWATKSQQVGNRRRASSLESFRAHYVAEMEYERFVA
jgi:hypothetical protein